MTNTHPPDLVLVPSTLCQGDFIGNRALKMMLSMYGTESGCEDADAFALGKEPYTLAPEEWPDWAAFCGCSERTLKQELRRAKKYGRIRYWIDPKTGFWLFDGKPLTEEEFAIVEARLLKTKKPVKV